MFRISRLIFPSIIFIGILLSSYKNVNNNKSNLTDSKIPKKNIIKNLEPKKQQKNNIAGEIHKNKLSSYEEKSEVLNLVKIGKLDPFSKEGTEINIFNSAFQLTGFISTGNGKYAFVNYLNKNGPIKEESIGGVNTNLLPDGAKLINISPKDKKITINFDNKDYIFEM